MKTEFLGFYVPSLIKNLSNKILSRSNYIIGIFRVSRTIFSIKGHKNCIFNKSYVYKSIIKIRGESNTVSIKDGFVANCQLTISGKFNSITFDSNERIRNLDIQIRGEHNLIKIGKGTSIGGARMINIGKNNNIIIGEQCMLSDCIEIWSSDSHPIYDLESGQIINEEKPIKIGNKVWIGSHVKILKGTEIGDNSVIAMGTIVTKNVPANVIYGGNPGRIIKHNITWDKYYKDPLLH